MNNRFKQIRKALNMTQEDFGKALERTKRSIIFYEKGERSIDIPIITLLKEKFNVNAEWLIFGTGSMFLEDKKDDNKYQWLINTLDKLPDEEVKRIESEAQKLLEKQYNKELIKNPSKKIG